MATVTINSASDVNAIFDDITKANGASDGVYAVGTTTDEDCTVNGNLNLSSVTTSGLTCVLAGYVTNGASPLSLSQFNLWTDGFGEMVLQLTPGAFRTTAGNTTLDLSSLNQTQLQSVRHVQMLFSDGGVGLGTLRIDSLTVTDTAAAATRQTEIINNGTRSSRTVTSSPTATRPYLINAGLYEPKTEALKALIWEGNPQYMPMWKGASAQAGQFLTDAELEYNCNVVWRPR